MSNETNTNIMTPADVDGGDANTVDNQQYIDAIKNLQQNTVSRERYAKLEQENKQLLDTLVSGGTITRQEPEKRKTAAEIREEFYRSNKQFSNLDYVKLSLALREANLYETGEDDYYVPNVISRERAQEIADIYQEMVDVADGSPVIFQQELDRRMVENPMANIATTRRKK